MGDDKISNTHKGGDAGKLNTIISANHLISRDNYVMWHNRTGYGPLNKVKLIGCVKNDFDVSNAVCLTCPMAKFSTLHYGLNKNIHHFPSYTWIYENLRG